MITLQDAIERVKLAADEDGILSSYTYDQIIDQLPDEERYSFTMALVDYGIRTKVGKKSHFLEMRKILADDFYDDDEEDEFSDGEEDEWDKAAQRFVQRPEGLWVPSDMEDSEEELEEPSEAAEFAPSHEEGVGGLVDEEVPQKPSMEFTQKSPNWAVEVLEGAGIYVDAQGNVSLYQNNVPGIYTKQIPLPPMPLEKAIGRLEMEADNIDKEQTRIEQLQDTLASLGSGLKGLDQMSDELRGKLQEGAQGLEEFKYSDQSTDENIRGIAQGLSRMRQYFEQDISEVETYENDISELQKRLDSYFQTQYDKYDEKLESIAALEYLWDLKSTDPVEFEDTVKGIGGISSKEK